MRARGPDGGSESEHVPDWDTVYYASTRFCPVETVLLIVKPSHAIRP